MSTVRWPKMKERLWASVALNSVLGDADAQHRDGDRQHDRRADVGVAEAAEHELEDEADQRAETPSTMRAASGVGQADSSFSCQ